MPILAYAHVTDYAAVAAVLDALPKLMAAHRTTAKLTVTAQARQVGIAGTTLSRLGATSTIGTAKACLTYLAKQ